MFVAYMMFFIFSEENETPDLIRDEYRHISYPVLKVIKDDPRLSASLTIDEETSDESSEEDDNYGNRRLSVG